MQVKTYKPKMAKDWFMKNQFYKLYMVREASVIFMAIYCFNWLVGLYCLKQGEASWNNWMAFQQNGFVMIFALFSAIISAYHTYTWFDIAPRAMPPIFIGDTKVKGKTITLIQWASCAVAAVILLLLLTWGL